MTQLVPLTSKVQIPAPIAAAGERAAYRFLEFFTAQIRNPNTRCAYARNVVDFLAWLERAGVASITDVRPTLGNRLAGELAAATRTVNLEQRRLRRGGAAVAVE